MKVLKPLGIITVLAMLFVFGGNALALPPGQYITIWTGETPGHANPVKLEIQELRTEQGTPHAFETVGIQTRILVSDPKKPDKQRVVIPSVLRECDGSITYTIRNVDPSEPDQQPAFFSILLKNGTANILYDGTHANVIETRAGTRATASAELVIAFDLLPSERIPYRYILLEREGKQLFVTLLSELRGGAGERVPLDIRLTESGAILYPPQHFSNKLFVEIKPAAGTENPAGIRVYLDRWDSSSHGFSVTAQLTPSQNDTLQEILLKREGAPERATAFRQRLEAWRNSKNSISLTKTPSEKEPSTLSTFRGRKPQERDCRVRGFEPRISLKRPPRK